VLAINKVHLPKKAPAHIKIVNAKWNKQSAVMAITQKNKWQR
jgi:hypothetical protein